MEDAPSSRRNICYQLLRNVGAAQAFHKQEIVHRPGSAAEDLLITAGGAQGACCRQGLQTFPGRLGTTESEKLLSRPSGIWMAAPRNRKP